MLFSRLWRYLTAEPELTIDLRRVNAEECRLRRMGLDDDAGYRAKIKKRMIEGLTSKQLALLFKAPQRACARRARRRQNVSPFPAAKRA